MTACALALVLDAGTSILPREWTLQAEGHASAFEDEAVLRAIARGPGAAVTAPDWASFATAIRRKVALDLAQAGLR